MLGTRDKDQIDFLYYSVCNFKLIFECLCPSVFLFVSLSPFLHLSYLRVVSMNSLVSGLEFVTVLNLMFTQFQIWSVGAPSIWFLMCPSIKRMMLTF